MLVVLLSSVTGLSQFYRVSNSVIGPEVAVELGLNAREVGFAGGVFFLALLVGQIPVGMAFDRWGARATLSSISGLAVLGALLIARATDATELISARFLVGIGCSASFMSSVFLCARWFGVQRFTIVLSWVFAASNVGTLVAATPLAWASATIGWRHSFEALAALTAVISLAFWWLVRDDPPGAVVPPRHRETFGEVWRGLLEVWRTPGLGPVFAMHTFTYACMVTVLGVWAGPYLHDVHGLNTVDRGNILFAMGVASILGPLVFGPMDRIFGTRKKIVVCGAISCIAVFGGLALVPHPPLWLATALLVSLPLLSSYAIVTVSQGRALFPERLAGRGVTTVNMAQVLGASFLPALAGYIVGSFAGPGDGPGAPAPEDAYRAVFGMLGAGSCVGLAFYLPSKDSRPMA